MTKIAELQAAVQAAEAAYEADRAQIQRLKAVDRTMNEGGEGYSQYEVQSERLYNQHAPIIKSAKAALFAAIWTPEVLAERRAVWNAAAVKCKNSKDVIALQDRLGYTLADIRAAKELHGIK